jgi:hypothetical protein
MCNSYESRSVSARAESYKKVRKQIYIYKNFTSPCFLGSGINIPDPQHWDKDGFLFTRDVLNFVSLVFMLIFRHKRKVVDTWCHHGRFFRFFYKEKQSPSLVLALELLAVLYSAGFCFFVSYGTVSVLMNSVVLPDRTCRNKT